MMLFAFMDIENERNLVPFFLSLEKGDLCMEGGEEKRREVGRYVGR